MTQAEYKREWRKRNGKQYLKTNMSARAAVARLIVDVAKAQPCADCGNRYPACVMDLDHRPGTEKVDKLSAIVRTGNLTKALAELPKCDVVCANCHRLRTRERLLDSN